MDALLHTTFAVTMAEGSSQANVLPSHAEAVLSVRILQGDTVESVRKYLESIMPGGVKVKAAYAENPHPAGDVKGTYFIFFQKPFIRSMVKIRSLRQISCWGPLIPEITQEYAIISIGLQEESKQTAGGGKLTR